MLMNDKEKKEEGRNSENAMNGITEAIFYSQLERGIIGVNEAFDNKLSEKIISLIDYLVYIKRKTDIIIVINSPGGVITDGLAIYDKIKSVEDICTIHTVVTGCAASMGAALLTMGAKGCRYAFPNSTIMIHQPLSGYQIGTKINDLRKFVAKTKKVEDKMSYLLSEASHISQEEMRKQCDRDNFLSAEEALELGLIDKIIKTLPEQFLKLPENNN